MGEDQVKQERPLAQGLVCFLPAVSALRGEALCNFSSHLEMLFSLNDSRCARTGTWVSRCTAAPAGTAMAAKAGLPLCTWPSPNGGEKPPFARSVCIWL